ncbi:ribonuclease H-like domain-containing protein [Rhizophagus irregularis DAOM 181602=DAOM 197198]|nr:ribonuclease H-like domain-containing protein [Rhizophagus irregularis DAOM 181602=DAOM 197198]
MNSQQKEKKPSGHPQNEVWKHFEKKPIKSAEEHLTNNCKEYPELVYAFYLGVVSSRDFGSEDASIPSPENNKKRKIQVEQRELTDWFESAKIIPQKEASITRALELLSGRFLNQETARINKKVKKIIEDSENLTLAIDGWTSLSGASIYNYIILTPDREQYLYSLNDYSSDHHTEEFLPSEITNIIGKIGSKKIIALVTDNAANCVKAREIVTSQFSNIIDLRYIAHFINLITKQIMGHDMAKQTIKSCNRIISFFKRSHIVGKLLADAATTLQIEGGGLKTYSETRWTSMYEAANSVSRLRIALEHVLMNNPDEITNKSVKKSIKSSEFFVNVNKLTKVLKLIKTAITLLESASTNLADCFIQLILLANAIKKLPSQGMVGFHQHCIESFNKYWDKFDPNIYILLYFLHPNYQGQGLKTEYWKIITTTAGQIWRNNGGDKKSCNHLLAQICNYELRRSPYNQDFDNSLETPIRWYSIKNKYDYLKDLAIMIFSITPHIARCERIFSTFG